MSSASASVHSLRKPPSRVRVVTAASLFDGHDAAINIMRRILQAQGAEVIHLGHDRSVDEIAEAAVQEDAHAVAVSSYQGGHMEFFSYLVERLRELGAPEVRVYGGGGGTITPEEIETLHGAGVTRIFSPEDGRSMGLEGMIRSIVEDCRERSIEGVTDELERLSPEDPVAVARLITWMEEEDTAEDGDGESAALEALRVQLEERGRERAAPVVGFTGTGGAGKSSVVDEILRRLRADFPEASIGLLLVDPTRRRSGGALLGDRIRLNAIGGGRVFVRSMATRQANLALSRAVGDAIAVMRAAGFDLVIVETAGIGQSDSEIVDLVDLSVYVMTPDFGAPSQLEKIDMIDLADLVVLNKYDRQGARDALRDVRKQWKRNRADFDRPDDSIPVFPAIARQWDDPGVERLYEALREGLTKAGARVFEREAREVSGEVAGGSLIPARRSRYLADIAESVRGYREGSARQSSQAATADGIARALGELGEAVPARAVGFGESGLETQGQGDASVATLRERHDALLAGLAPELREQLRGWSETREHYLAEEQAYLVRGKEIRVVNHVESLSGSAIPKVALPRSEDWGELVRYLALENLPGCFPFAAGVFPFRRAGEDPARMFAGEGGPERTNRRFHFLCEGQPAARLSTAFDSVTLYGRDPAERPDVFGKVGNSGVSICTLDDAKKLYSGFDLCAPETSVSLTINGPAPMVLAFFLNAAIDQQVERHLGETGQLEAVRERLGGDALPRYAGDRPPAHDGLGLGLLGIPGDRAVDADTYARIKTDVLQRVRGTVQADILKEDQAQNTCIFSTEFALKVMGDIQEYFNREQVSNFYSVSVSGYHMAEAGANPISQLAFTLANGFTFVEYYLARGMEVDDFAPNFSFFFSNGLDAEYNVIGRVARRIWAIAMRERYGASERSQKLKYHIQTSGRSLHAQEMAFNDIRTTLQALTALQDNCNSLHTNAYDEAVTTPTEESVRRALAIQLIINKELGSGRNENAIQGAYFIEELTELVEEAVLAEFDRLSERGGVLGAMETLYQRSKIQEESLTYESQKHSGELPIIGVNTFENPDAGEALAMPDQLMRSSDDEKRAQLANLDGFHGRWSGESAAALQRLQQVARAGGNVFGELMETVKVASLGQISDALFEVGGRYRRSM
ncbi:MAG: methylmalonyl-CoA mutase family protein [Deltaproteobacteria bacterium]|nr:methylmalonyl-CoA mutase family protein [Deltaproteobacteria bacterium]MBW2417284.1 methylmalonyl-CoA mutase family protein [Deltaproteobacteria bacterium]